MKTKTQNKEKYSTEDLITICERAVVPFTEWGNRDSYSAQVQLSDIYSFLKSGCDYTIGDNTDERTIWISFENITEQQEDEAWRHNLNIDSLDDYRKEFGYDGEMFDGYGLRNSNSKLGYLPTKKRLQESNGGDWY